MLEHDVDHARFMMSLREYLDGLGMPLRKVPVLAGREIDLYQLYQAVDALGGYHAVTQDKRWAEVGQALKVKEASHSAYALRQNYLKLLLQYELSESAAVQGAATSSGGGGAGYGASAVPDGSSLPLPVIASVIAAGVDCGGAGSGAVDGESGDGAGCVASGADGTAGRDGGGGRGVVAPMSCGSLALRLQDIEERIPWGALRPSDGAWDWEIIRPTWLQLLTEGPPQVRYLPTPPPKRVRLEFSKRRACTSPHHPTTLRSPLLYLRACGRCGAGAHDRTDPVHARIGAWG